MRRRLSTAFVVAGACLVFVAGASIARGAVARDAARSRWAEIEAHRAVVGARAAMLSGSNWATALGGPVARLVIPRIGLDEVVVEGVGDEELRAGPGHMTASALPGENGRSVISAHRDRHFHPLGKVVVGDTILTESRSGKFAWKVTRIRVVNADAPVLRSTVGPTLTLTTCWPIRYLGPAPDRLIVDAELTSSRVSDLIFRARSERDR